MVQFKYCATSCIFPFLNLSEGFAEKTLLAEAAAAAQLDFYSIAGRGYFKDRWERKTIFHRMFYRRI